MFLAPEIFWWKAPKISEHNLNNQFTKGHGEKFLANRPMHLGDPVAKKNLQ